MIHEDHSTEMSRQIQSFVHETSCKCEICKIPQLKFIMFQIGCHYSRLLWMINKSDISMKFNDFAFEPWQNVCDKLRRMKDCEFLMINKADFAVFSVRWLLQCADTMITLSNYEEVEEIYKEVELICIDSVPDYECFKEALFCRKENLSFLLEHGARSFNVPKDLEPAVLTYEEFTRLRSDKMIKKKPSKSPVQVKRALPASSTLSKKIDSIYIDSGDESSSKIVKKVKKATSKSTLESKATAKLTLELKTVSKSTVVPKPTAKPSAVIDLTHDTPASSTSRTRPTRRRMI